MRAPFFLGASALFIVMTLRAQTPIASVPPAPSFQFDGQHFVRVSTSTTHSGYMEEYLPAGQTLAHWTCMTSIHHLTTVVPDPVAATQGVADAVRRANANAQVVLMNNSSNGDALVDFVTWPAMDSGQPAYIEHDVCKYRKAPTGGLIAFQYARRAYGADESLLLQNLKAERQRLIPLAGQFDPQ